MNNLLLFHWAATSVKSLRVGRKVCPTLCMGGAVVKLDVYTFTFKSFSQCSVLVSVHSVEP